MATGNGETECLIFGKNYNEVAKDLDGHNVSVIAGFPFISAYAAYVHIHDIKDIAGLLIYFMFISAFLSHMM